MFFAFDVEPQNAKWLHQERVFYLVWAVLGFAITVWTLADFPSKTTIIFTFPIELITVKNAMQALSAHKQFRNQAVKELLETVHDS
jgi:hypothetical protein